MESISTSKLQPVILLDAKRSWTTVCLKHLKPHCVSRRPGRISNRAMIKASVVRLAKALRTFHFPGAIATSYYYSGRTYCLLYRYRQICVRDKKVISLAGENPCSYCRSLTSTRFIDVSDKRIFRCKIKNNFFCQIRTCVVNNYYFCFEALCLY
jgi:hypothetical protein